MSRRVRRVAFAEVSGAWAALVRAARPAAGPFVTPAFQGAWWEVFGDGWPLDLLAVEEDGALTGVLPLSRRDGAVTFLGDHEVADYMDFVAAAGHEEAVVDAFFDHLDAVGASGADLRGLSAGSWSLEALCAGAPARGWRAEREPEAVCPVIALPDSWAAYVDGLRAKDRREVRRKLRTLRRMADALEFEAATSAEEVGERLPRFLQMMRESRDDKAAFMTEEMATFFHGLASGLAAAGYVRLYTLRIGGEVAAGVLAFEHDDELLFYNSGYDPRYAEMAVGLASKVLCIRDAIERGLARANFLRGDEPYKFQLGAEPHPVTRLRLTREG